MWRIQWMNRECMSLWLWVALAVMLTGCVPEVTNLNTGSGGSGGSSSSNSSGGSNTCILGQSTVGNCVIGLQ